jgi:hypothetical protein
LKPELQVRQRDAEIAQQRVDWVAGLNLDAVSCFDFLPIEHASTINHRRLARNHPIDIEGGQAEGGAAVVLVEVPFLPSIIDDVFHQLTCFELSNALRDITVESRTCIEPFAKYRQPRIHRVGLRWHNQMISRFCLASQELEASARPGGRVFIFQFA